MSRKDDSKAKDAIVTVNIDDFTRTRDSVIVSLATLQSAVSDLSRAYINHANTVLNRGPFTLDTGVLTGGITSGITTSLLENGLLGGGRHGSPGAKSEVGEKKKRKRAPHDPNAPKRALTPYFLYMQNNRSAIAQELGANVKPKDVADEGTRRWAEMPEAQKEVWKKLYANNLAVYKEKMKAYKEKVNAYKAGLPIADDDNTKAADQLQQSVALAEASAEESEEEEEEEEESSPEPAKEPTPPRSGKRRRTATEVKTAKEVSSPVSAKKASPEKKKPVPKSKKDKEEPASTRKSTGGAAESKRSKKKRKSEIEPED